VKHPVSLLAAGFFITTVMAGPPQGTPSPRAIAPIDVTGYWVSVITEDWRIRMITPPKGDFLGVPLNSAGVKLGNAWDPSADIRNGHQCKAYGAAGIMRMPTRLHITWVDDNTLKFEFDAGQQTRLVYFDKSRPAGGRNLQGHAVAEWFDMRQPPRGAGRGQTRTGALKVVTTNLSEQYHRKNGSPASANATVTDTFDIVPGPGGTEWLIVETIVDDPTYLTATMVTSSHFKREPDSSKWNLTPCEVELPPVPRIELPN
jgi:hypothetical protein